MSSPLRLATRLDAVKPSITMAVTAKAAELRAQGHDIISFGAGEPDFDTPEHIKEAAHRALDKGVAKYTHVAGLIELRDAIATELSAVHNTSVESDRVIVSTGAKHSLYNVFMALVGPGDEVIIPAPYWVSYPDMVRLAGATPVIVHTAAKDGFAIDPDALQAAITPKTRAMVLNSPSNPTGALWTRHVLTRVSELCIEHDLLVISDDIYRQLVYTDGSEGNAVYTSIASLSPEIAARTVLIDGVSKTYAMTGWRIGYAAGPAELIAAMRKIQGQSTSNASHIAQMAALEAITGPQDCVGKMRAVFNERRKAMCARLKAIAGVQLREPDGAFYCFPDLSAFVGRNTVDGKAISDDVALCNYLVERGVALVPGSGFGAPGFARLSYACSMDNIEQGLDCLASALGELS